MLPFASGNVRNRSEHNDGRNGKLEGKCRETERAARSTRCRGQRLVQDSRCGMRPAPHRPQCHLEGGFEGFGSGLSDDVGGRRRERVLDEFDRLAEHVGKA